MLYYTVSYLSQKRNGARLSYHQNDRLNILSWADENFKTWIKVSRKKKRKKREREKIKTEYF